VVIRPGCDDDVNRAAGYKSRASAIADPKGDPCVSRPCPARRTSQWIGTATPCRPAHRRAALACAGGASTTGFTPTNARGECQCAVTLPDSASGRPEKTLMIFDVARTPQFGEVVLSLELTEQIFRRLPSKFTSTLRGVRDAHATEVLFHTAFAP